MDGADGNPSSEVTVLLQSWQAGDQRALEQLTPIVYAELRRLASSYLRRERPSHTLQPTALVHEAYMRLVAQNVPQFEGRAHFFSVAATLMRQVLVDFARKHRSQKHGGGNIISLDGHEPGDQDPIEHILDIHNALNKLAEVDQRKSRVIELKYFGGLQRDEIAQVIGLSVASVKRDLLLGEAYLRRELAPQGSGWGSSGFSL